MELDNKTLIYRSLFKQNGLDPIAFYQRAWRHLIENLDEESVRVFPYDEFLDIICRYKERKNRKKFPEDGVFLFPREEDFMLITTSWFLLGKKIVDLWNEKEIKSRIIEFYGDRSVRKRKINVEHKLGIITANVSISYFTKKRSVIGKISILENIDRKTDEYPWNGISAEVLIPIKGRSTAEYNKIDVYSPVEIFLSPYSFSYTSYLGTIIRENGSVKIDEHSSFNTHTAEIAKYVWDRVNCALLRFREIISLSRELRKTDKLKNMILKTLNQSE